MGGAYYSDWNTSVVIVVHVKRGAAISRLARMYETVYLQRRFFRAVRVRIVKQPSQRQQAHLHLLSDLTKQDTLETKTLFKSTH